MAVDVLIRDGSPDWWESPDIWVVPGTNPNGPPGTPIVGKPAYLWARVSNNGDTLASQVQVDFWVANPSLQIRKSTANHIGTAFADVPPGGLPQAQTVLCLVPWQVTLVNGGHECVVVEASTPADPLNPPPADPDVLDPPTYPQVAQRNLTVATMAGHNRTEIIIGVHAGHRANKVADVEVRTGGELPRGALESLGLRVSKGVSGNSVSAVVSGHSLCGAPIGEGRSEMRLRVPHGTSAPVYLNIEARRDLTADEYAVVRVIERDGGRAVGGLSVVVISGEQHPGGAQ